VIALDQAFKQAEPRAQTALPSRHFAIVRLMIETGEVQ
jgi:hypothetical protein